MGLADSVQYTLRSKDLAKMGDLFDLDIALLEKLNSLRLLNATYIRNLLIRADYERLTSGLHWLENQKKEYRFPEVISALQREYRISRREIQSIVKSKNMAVVFCKRCGIRISKSTFDRTGGLCSNCFADDLEL